MAADDERLGLLLRTIRRQSAQTQEQLAAAAGVPVRDLMNVEAGRVGEVRLDRVRRLFSSAGGQARLTAWWNGAAADRLLDARHAALVERAAQILIRRGWQTAVEATFSEYGERGSIDLLGLYPRHRAVAVCEVKSSIGSLEETNRMLDVKVRLIPKLTWERFGWRPTHVGRLLVLPDDSTIRRTVTRHAATMDSLYPARSRDVRAWLHHPDQPIRGIWFLSEPQDRQTGTR
jgi:transcriptional regulator with XRE-family HTH domain